MTRSGRLTALAADERECLPAPNNEQADFEPLCGGADYVNVTLGRRVQSTMETITIRAVEKSFLLEQHALPNPAGTKTIHGV